MQVKDVKPDNNKAISVYKDISADESTSKFFSSYSPDDFKTSTPEKFSDEEMDEILGVLKTSFKEHLKIDEKDFPIHVVFFLFRAQRISTSPQVKYAFTNCYNVGNRSFAVKDAWIFTEVKNATRKHNRENGLRTFCCSLEDMYLSAANLVPDLLKSRSVARKGVPTGNEQCGADFLTGSSKLQTDVQKAITISAARHAIENKASSAGQRVLVSLYDYGK
ncbi:MAG: minor coat protein [Plant associated closterovirus 1]|nr:MAG: minor coat protein [Plant associated closterovirus 1]